MMKILNPKILLNSIVVIIFGLILVGCEQQTANVSNLTKPLETPGASPSPSPTPPPSIDPRRTDLNRVVMGSPAPDFALEDMNRKIVRLSDFRGKKNIVLVFYRGHF